MGKYSTVNEENFFFISIFFLISIFFSVYLFFIIPYSCQSIWSWEQGYPVWAWQSSICGAVSGKKKQFLFTWLLELVLITEG